jgi:3-hydroxyisobutyrate dehydrogenase
MARSLLRKGFRTTGSDLNPAAAGPLKELGGEFFDSPAMAAMNADIAFVVVVNAQQMEDVLSGPEGILGVMTPGSVIVGSVTIAPEQARSFAEAARESGIYYLDAPISGGAKRAEAGELTVLASGSKEAFLAARPALSAVAQKIYELGEEAGTGSAFKIVNQLLAGVHIAAACEAVALARRMDLNLNKVFEVITNSAGNSWMFEDRVPHILENDYSPRSAVSIFSKDLGIVTEIGRSSHFPTMMAASALQMFVMTEAAGMSSDDDSSVARMLADLAGVDIQAGCDPV